MVEQDWIDAFVRTRILQKSRGLIYDDTDCRQVVQKRSHLSGSLLDKSGVLCLLCLAHRLIRRIRGKHRLIFSRRYSAGSGSHGPILPLGSMTTMGPFPECPLLAAGRLKPPCHSGGVLQIA
jgi:hypothetical protein